MFTSIFTSVHVHVCIIREKMERVHLARPKSFLFVKPVAPVKSTS